MKGYVRWKRMDAVLTQRHARRHVGILHHLRKLFETDLSIVVLVRFHNRLIHDLCDG